MKLTRDEIFDLMRCCQWLTHDDADINDPEQRAEELRYKKLVKKMKKFWEQAHKVTYTLK